MLKYIQCDDNILKKKSKSKSKSQNKTSFESKKKTNPSRQDKTRFWNLKRQYQNEIKFNILLG